MKFGIIRFVDNFFIRPLVWLLIPFNLFNIDKKIDQIHKVLIIRPGGIGDAIFTLSFIRKLKKIQPNVKISVLAMPRNKEIFENNVDKLFIFDDNKTFNIIYLLRLLKELKKEKFDIIFDLEQWYRFPAVISWIVGDKIRVGYSTNEKKFLYTKKIDYFQDKYEVLSFLDQLKFLGFNKEDDRIYLPIPKKDILFANKFLKNNNLKNFIIMGPGAYKKEKMWSKDKFVELSNKLVNNSKIVFVGDNNDKEIIDYIISKINKKENVISLAGKISLMQCAAIIKRAKLYIGVDSGLMHIAAAVNTPTISMFGPTIKEKWAPKGKKHYIISKNLTCSPCAYGLFAHIPKCKKIECMEIPVKDVLNKVKLVISSA